MTKRRALAISALVALAFTVTGPVVAANGGRAVAWGEASIVHALTARPANGQAPTAAPRQPGLRQDGDDSGREAWPWPGRNSRRFRAEGEDE